MLTNPGNNFDKSVYQFWQFNLEKSRQGNDGLGSNKNVDDVILFVFVFMGCWGAIIGEKIGNTRRNSDAVIVSGFVQTETTLMSFYLYLYLYLWAVEVQSMAGNR